MTFTAYEGSIEPKGIAMVTARNAVREAGAGYKRHQPELTLLYQIIETHYPEFIDYMDGQGLQRTSFQVGCPRR